MRTFIASCMHPFSSYQINTLKPLALVLLSTLFVNGCTITDRKRHTANEPPVEKNTEEEWYETDDPVFISTALGGSKKFTAGTWNLSQLSMDTAKNKVDPYNGLAGAPKGKKGEIVYDLLQKLGIDIVALQELYIPIGTLPKANFPISIAGKGDYKMLTGRDVFNRGNLKEYCPIVYADSIFNCKSTTIWPVGDRKIHWAKCTFDNDPKKRHFYFGCTHLSSDKAELSGNLKGLFEKQLTNNTTRPRIASKAQKDRDTFILGGDFNSSFNGHHQKIWKERHKNWSDVVTKKLSVTKVPQSIVFEKLNTPPDYTKIRKDSKTGAIGPPGGARRRVDELIWSFKDSDDIEYIGGSKKAIAPSNLTLYFSFSDHIPSVASFKY